MRTYLLFTIGLTGADILSGRGLIFQSMHTTHESAQEFAKKLSPHYTTAIIEADVTQPGVPK